jgi:acyl-CoA thioesterase
MPRGDDVGVAGGDNNPPNGWFVIYRGTTFLVKPAPVEATMTEPDEDLELARRSAATMFEKDVASQALGITIADVAPGQATARLTVTPAMVNGHGVAHGGYVFLLADTAFAFACNTRGEATVARTGEIVFVMPVRAGDELAATAVERVRYGRSGVFDATVRRSDGVVVAEFRGQSRELGGRGFRA